MHNNKDYQKITIIVILSGCGAAIALAVAVLICCQLFVKPKYAKYACSNSELGLERQTTTSDENYMDYNSGCNEDSFCQREQCDSDTNGEAVSSPDAVVAQTHRTPSPPQQTSPTPTPTPIISAPTQVKFAPQPKRTRKASLPLKLVDTKHKTEIRSSDTNDNHRRASAGIIRQNSFDDDYEEEVGYNQSELSERRKRNFNENKTIATDVLRRQYRELWRLRATFEAEEVDTTSSASVASSDSMPSNQQKLSKNDSGYKSIERRDYSIDYKSEYMFRQFSSQAPTPPRHAITHQHSIKEELETDIPATFV